MPNTSNLPLSRLAFQGYLSPSHTDGRDYFATIAHFYVAQRFRDTDADLYRAVVDSTSLKEIRKLSKRNASKGRDDWDGVKARVLVCALCYAYWADENSSLWDLPTEQIASELSEVGFPLKFSIAAVTEFQRLRTNPSWLFLGIDAAPPDVMGKRMNALHRKYKRAWTIHFWTGRHTNWRLHDWAVEQYIPIVYHGQLKERMTDNVAKRIILKATNVCIFERRGGKAMDSEIRLVKALKAPLEIDFFSQAHGEQIT